MNDDKSRKDNPDVPVRYHKPHANGTKQMQHEFSPATTDVSLRGSAPTRPAGFRTKKT
jgi:hypothetical protein